MGSAEFLSSPLGELGCNLSDSDLRETAYEILVSTSRTSGFERLNYFSQSERMVAEVVVSPLSAEGSLSPSPWKQRSDASTATGKVKKGLGIKLLRKNPCKESSPCKALKRSVTVGELMRMQMRVSKQTDLRIRFGLLRISTSQLGRPSECIVLPLELLHQFKASDFPDQQEYEAWQNRHLKVLEAGLLLHPLVMLDKSHVACQMTRQILQRAAEKPLETGENSVSIQVLRTAVMTLACRSTDGFSSDVCHWADGFPLNLHLYNMLLAACFNYDEGSIIDEIDVIMELIKKSWIVLGINQMLHNLCFLWILFHCFVTTGQTEIDLLLAADNLLMEVAKDAKATKDATYTKILCSVLSSVMGWAEKKLLAYHDTFTASNIDSMQYIVSLGVLATKILMEDISHECQHEKRELGIACNTVDTYIRSSLKLTFAQMMEKMYSNMSLLRGQTTVEVIVTLAKDISDLAKKEKEIFSPILKRWHPLPAGVAVSTLHFCFGNELKQFVSSITDLTFDSIQALKAVDKLEKDLVQIAVEDAVDSEDGGKGIICEMPPYEAELAITDLTKAWMKTRLDRLRVWVHRNLQQETWNPRANKESIASSAVEVLRLVDENLDAFLWLPTPMHPALLPDFMIMLDRILQYYITEAKGECGTRSNLIPPLPALTWVEIGSILRRKKDKSQHRQPRKSQVGAMNADDSLSLQQLCVRMNTLHYIRTELEALEKKIKTCLQNVESVQASMINKFDNKFELSLAACHEGIQNLCETTACKVIFNDLSRVLWDHLYVGEVSASRIDPFLKELDLSLVKISTTIHVRLRNRVITGLLKASFDGFLLVLLAGGPDRSFTCHSSHILEDDFKALKDLYLADGDGLPKELVEEASAQVESVLPLFWANTESLIVRFKRMMTETHGTTSKYQFPLPPTLGQWSPTDASTILRVLCHRRDKMASKFLEKCMASQRRSCPLLPQLFCSK